MRGSLAKTNIGNAILQVFPGSFIDSDKKTIRIPTNCEGEPIEVKVTLTAAKDIIGGTPTIPVSENKVKPQNTEMTDSEIQEIKDLITRLGL